LQPCAFLPAFPLCACVFRSFPRPLSALFAPFAHQRFGGVGGAAFGCFFLVLVWAFFGFFEWFFWGFCGLGFGVGAVRFGGWFWLFFGCFLVVPQVADAAVMKI